jgi:hypothetical protein
MKRSRGGAGGAKLADRALKSVSLASFALVHPPFAGRAAAQAIDQYFPTNVPAYQDWAAAAGLTRQTTDYEALGVRLGSIVLFPSASESIGYDTDPFGGAGVVKKQASAYFETKLSVTADTNWARDGVNAAVSWDDSQYTTLGKSTTDWSATAGGTIDYGDDRILLGYSHVNAVSLPTEIGSVGLQQAVNSQVDDVRISDTIGPGRIVLVPSLIAESYEFSTPSGELSSADADLFNRRAITGSLSASYSFAGGHNLVLIINDSQYYYNGGQALLRPADYNDSFFLAGIEYQQSALLAYRLVAGYENRISTGQGTYRGSLAEPAAELEVIWRPSSLTSFTGKLSESFQNAPTGNAQGVAESDLQLALAHIWHGNIQLQATAELLRGAFPTDGEVQTTAQAGASAEWLLSRRLALNVQYDFTKSVANNVSLPNYIRHQIFLQAKIQW